MNEGTIKNRDLIGFNKCFTKHTVANNDCFIRTVFLALLFFVRVLFSFLVFKFLNVLVPEQERKHVREQLECFFIPDPRIESWHSVKD